MAAGKTPAPAGGDGGAEGVRKRWASKRRSLLTDEELRRQLLQAPEVDLEAAPGTIRRVISVSGKTTNKGIDVVPGVVAGRPDLLGLPMQTGAMAREEWGGIAQPDGAVATAAAGHSEPPSLD